MRALNKVAGLGLMVVGLLHIAYTFFALPDVVTAMWQEGVFNTVEGHDRRALWLYSLGFGLFGAVLGFWVHSARRDARPVPGAVGWAVFGFGVLGVVLLPASPFWLVLLLAVGLISGRRTSADQSSVLPGGSTRISPPPT